MMNNTPTLEELYGQYQADVSRSNEEYKKWLMMGNKAGRPREYFQVNYDYYQNGIAKAIQAEFNLTNNQTKYIMTKAYGDYHAYFSDMFYGARELAEFVTNFPPKD